MKSKILVLSLFLATLSLVGCKVHRQAEISTAAIEASDSSVSMTVRDTISEYEKQDNKTIVTDSSFLKTDLAFSAAKILPDGKLFHSIENFGKIPSKVYDNTKIINKWKNTTKTKTITLEKKIKVRGIIWWSGIVGLAVLCIGIIIGLLRIKKKLLPL